MAYEIEWAKNAVIDLSYGYTVEEQQLIISEIERIANAINPEDDETIKRVACTNHEWLRLKIRRPRQIRIFFSQKNDPPTLIIEAIIRRGDNTYTLCEINWKAQRKQRVG